MILRTVQAFTDSQLWNVNTTGLRKKCLIQNSEVLQQLFFTRTHRALACSDSTIETPKNCLITVLS